MPRSGSTARPATSRRSRPPPRRAERAHRGLPGGLRPLRVIVGQVLLTAGDLDPTHRTTATRTAPWSGCSTCASCPIVNENDTVATHEIRFGDNDRLAALVAQLVGRRRAGAAQRRRRALHGPPPTRGATRVPAVVGGAGPRRHRRSAAPGERRHRRHGDQGRGRRDRDAAGRPRGAHVSARRSAQALAGEDVGTVFTRPARAAPRSAGSGWRTPPRPGRLLLDAGAVRAVIERRTSLLPAGVTGVEGDLRRRRPGRARAPRRTGRSAAGWSPTTPTEVPGLLGRSTRDLARELGPEYEREVVHRDDLVIL